MRVRVKDEGTEDVETCEPVLNKDGTWLTWSLLLFCPAVTTAPATPCNSLLKSLDSWREDS